MQRYLCVRGVPGQLCGHPLQKEGERRYLGKSRMSRAEIDKLRAESDSGIDQAAMYRDVEEVVADSDHVRKALASGAVEQVGKMKAAKSLAAARQALASKPAPAKAPKKAASAGGSD